MVREEERIPLAAMNTPLPDTMQPSQASSLCPRPESTDDSETLAGGSSGLPRTITTTAQGAHTSFARTDTAYTGSSDDNYKAGLNSDDGGRSGLDLMPPPAEGPHNEDGDSLAGEVMYEYPLISEDGTHLTPYLIRIVLIACLSGLQFGMDTGAASGMLVAIRSDLGHPLSAGEQELIVSATTVGAILGSLFAGRLADWAGRKKVMLAAALFFLLGGLEQAASQVIQELVVGRGIQGIAVGMASMVTPLFLAEVAPSDVRGRLVGINSLLITGGQVVSYIVSAVFYHMPHGWRWMALSGCVPAVVQLLSLIALDESPRWLIHQGRVSQARHVLGRIYPGAQFLAIESEITRITNTFGQTAYEARASARAANTEQRAVQPGRGGARLRVKMWWRNAGESIQGSFSAGTAQLKSLFGVRANRRALELAAGLLFFQQMIGFNSLMYFSSKLLLMAGFENPNAMAVGIAVANLMGTVIAIRLVDKVGRRRLMLYTIAFAAVSLGFLATALYNVDMKDVTEQPASHSGSNSSSATPAGHAGWAYASLTAMIFFTLFYALGLGIVPWLVCSEVFASPVRAVGGGLASAVNWVANLVVSATFLDLVRAVTASGSFGIYTGVAVLAWVFTYMRLPELSGVSINDVQQAFGSAEHPSEAEAVYQALPQHNSLTMEVDEEREGDEADRRH